MAISEFAENYLSNAQGEIDDAAEELISVMAKYHGIFTVSLECKGAGEVKTTIVANYKKLDEHLRIHLNRTINGEK